MPILGAIFLGEFGFLWVLSCPDGMVLLFSVIPLGIETRPMYTYSGHFVGGALTKYLRIDIG